MVLVDTSVWIHHFLQGDDHLSGLLEESVVAVHPFVIGELACGVLKNRKVVLEHLLNLPHVPVASEPEVLHFIEARRLMGTGIGYVDAHLLASTLLADYVSLLTRDAALNRVARRLGLSSPQ